MIPNFLQLSLKDILLSPCIRYNIVIKLSPLKYTWAIVILSAHKHHTSKYTAPTSIEFRLGIPNSEIFKEKKLFVKLLQKHSMLLNAV